MFRAWRISAQFYEIQLVYNRMVIAVSGPIFHARVAQVLAEYNAKGTKQCEQKN